MSAAFGCALCMAGNCIAIRYYSNEPANNYIIWGMLGTLIIGLPYFIYEQVWKQYMTKHKDSVYSSVLHTLCLIDVSKRPSICVQHTHP